MFFFFDGWIYFIIHKISYPTYIYMILRGEYNFGFLFQFLL